MLKQKMAMVRDPVPGQDYVMRMVCRSLDFERYMGGPLGGYPDDINRQVRFLFFTRDWKYK